MKTFYEHKPHRLQNYNYSNNGTYFITICTKNKECLLGDIVVAVDAHGNRQSDNINDFIYQNSTNAEMIFSEYGKITEKYIKSSNTAYNYLSVDNYVIMPNHIHLIISVQSDNFICKTKSCHDVIPVYVSSLKTLIIKEVGFSLFQRNYHDHIIIDEKEYEKIWNYIDTNVSNWVTDKFYMY